MKYIIKESKLKLIVEQLDKTDTIFVTNKNPFKDSKFENCLRMVNSNMQDGECYTAWTKKARDFFYQKVRELLLNKTIRIHPKFKNKSEVYVIDKIDRLLLEDDFQRVKKTNFPLSMVGIGTKLPNALPFGQSFTINIWNDNYLEEWEKNIKNFLKEKLPKVNELSDDMFEIRQVKKQKTDFQP
jgi:hypothetical protein